MTNSLNAQLIAEGHAYPAYYTGLPTDLRNQLTNLANDAKTNGSDIWQVDISLSDTQVNNADNLEQLSMWPKLYRRLFTYFADDNTGIGDFEEWLRDDGKRDDELWIISRGEFGNMHDIFTITDNEIRMTISPDDIVIVPG